MHGVFNIAGFLQEESLELFIELFNVTNGNSVPHSSFLFVFLDEEIHISSIDIKWLSMCDYLDFSPFGWRASSSVTLLSIHQLIKGSKS